MSVLYVDNLEPNLGSRVMAAGHVVQVVQSDFGGIVYLANPSNPTSVGHTLTITPTSSSSKVLIQYHFHWGQYKSVASNQDNMKYWTIYRGSTNIAPYNSRFFAHQNEASGSIDFNEQTQQSSISFLDTPNTTSAITYDLRAWSDNSTQVSISYNQRGALDNRGTCTAIAMEIAQ